LKKIIEAKEQAKTVEISAFFFNFEDALDEKNIVNARLKKVFEAAYQQENSFALLSGTAANAKKFEEKLAKNRMKVGIDLIFLNNFVKIRECIFIFLILLKFF